MHVDSIDCRDLGVGFGIWYMRLMHEVSEDCTTVVHGSSREWTNEVNGVVETGLQ